MKTSSVEKKFLYALLAIVILITLAIFYPFLTVFIIAGAFTVVLTPIYLWIQKHITRGNKTIASLITVILFLIVLCVPLFLIGTVIFNQTQNTYYSIVANQNPGTFIQTIDTYIKGILPEGFTFNTQEKITQLLSFFSNNLAGLFTSTINTIMMSVLTILSIFYLLKNGKEWKKEIIQLSPISDENDKKIINRLIKTINGVLVGYILIGLIQGILMWIGLSMFGVPNAAFWGLVAAIAALIPPFGTGIITIPAVIYLYLTGHQLHALGLLTWGALLVGMIDNFLNPYIVGKKIEMPAFLTLFSVLGGIALLGPVGILIGPITVGMLHTFILIYKNGPEQNKTL